MMTDEEKQKALDRLLTMPNAYRRVAFAMEGPIEYRIAFLKKTEAERLSDLDRAVVGEYVKRELTKGPVLFNQLDEMKNKLADEYVAHGTLTHLAEAWKEENPNGEIPKEARHD